MVANRFFLTIFLASIALLTGCAVPFQNQSGGFNGIARDPVSGSVLAFGGSGNTGSSNQRMGTVQVQRLHPSVIVNNLDPELCMGGYIHNRRGWTCPGGQIIPGTQQVSRTGYREKPETVIVPAKCDFGDGVVAHSYEGQAGCDKLAGRMTVKVPATTKRVEVTPAYCILKRSRNGQSEVKNVLNPVRQQSYCDNDLPNGLRNGTMTWETLQVVNVQ